GTMKHYGVTKRYFQHFLEKKKHVKDIFLSELNYKFVTDFEMFIQQQNFLNAAQPCGKNTTMKHIERLRKVINLAIKNEWIDKDPFAKFKVSFTQSNREYLSEEELKFNTYDFKKVTESCPVPVFGLGAEKTPLQLQALQLASEEINDGARGVVFGRNAIQVKDPFAFQAALCEVVKKGLSPQDAVLKYDLKDQ
ncbi:MAG: phage integrase SAM-like domain-containing protein, partial [Bacteroidota bacterium]